MASRTGFSSRRCERLSCTSVTCTPSLHHHHHEKVHVRSVLKPAVHYSQDAVAASLGKQALHSQLVKHSHDSVGYQQHAGSLPADDSLQRQGQATRRRQLLLTGVSA